MTDQIGQATREKLQQFIAKIERIEAEQAELASDKREVYSEVKSFGFDTGILKKTIALRKLDADTRAEQEALLEMYMEVAENNQVEQTVQKIEVILMNRDGSRQNIRVEPNLHSFKHDDKFYAHYIQNAYKQV